MSSGIQRRPNGSIIGSSVIPTIANSKRAYGIWEKNEATSLIGANLWVGLDGLSISYDFTSNNATATFFGMTVSGLSTSSQSGGLYTTSGTIPEGGSVGGANGGTGGNLGNNYSGGGGSLGGANGFGGGASYSSVRAPNDVSGLLAAATSAGAASDFAYGASGSETGFGGGRFAGGGGAGKGFFSYQPPTSGGNAGILIRYGIINNIDYFNYNYQLINQSSGAGSFTLPHGINYVKIWCIGRGGNGLSGGNGGGGGGVAWCELVGY